MKVLSVSTLGIYLPTDKAPVPFGDPIEGVTATAAAPGVITIPGYVGAVNDAIALTYLAGGSMPTGLTYGTTYYVVTPSGNTVTLSATKGGSAITTSTAGASLVAHLLSNEVDGVTLPFKPTGTVIAENNTGSSITLQGAPDVNVAAPYGVYQPPGGPGTFVTIATIAAGGAAEVVLNYDWIKIAAGGPLVLQQN